MKYVTDYCTRCGKEIRLSLKLAEWVAGCVVCDDCPIEEPPCETCGDENCKGECCECYTCIKRKRNCEPGWCRRVFELCDEAFDACIKRRRCVDNHDFVGIQKYSKIRDLNRRKAIRLLTQMFGVP